MSKGTEHIDFLRAFGVIDDALERAQQALDDVGALDL
jgi:hypothetical protein